MEIDIVEYTPFLDGESGASIQSKLNRLGDNVAELSNQAKINIEAVEATILGLPFPAFSITALTADTTIQNPTIMSVGSSGTMIIKQDAVGGFILGWGSYYFSPTGTIEIGINPYDEILVDYRVVSSTKVLLTLVSNYNLGI